MNDENSLDLNSLQANQVRKEPSTTLQDPHGRILLQNDRDQQFDIAVLGDDNNANPDVVAQNNREELKHKNADSNKNTANTIFDLEEEPLATTKRHSEDAFARGVMAERERWLNKWKSKDLFQQKQDSNAHHETTNDDMDDGSDDEASTRETGGNAATDNEEEDDNDGIVSDNNNDHHHYESIPLYEVMIMTIAMATAAGLGAVPFFFVRTLSKRWSALATAVACGVMFAASFDLIHEGQPYGGKLVIFGIFLGGLFIRYMQHRLGDVDDVQFGNVKGNRARRLVLMIGIMAAHAVGEGCGVGVSFVGERGWTQGVLTTLAIGVHNIPEGLAKATVLVSQGATAQSALLWSILTCLPQPLVAIPSFLFVEGFRSLLPIALGFAAGCMIWMVFAELLPEALEDAQPAEVASAATLAAAGLEAVRMMFEGLETSSGTFVSPLHGSHYEHMSTAAIGGGMQIVAAALGSVVVGGTPLPTPVALGFSSVAAGSSAFFPLFRLLFDATVPLLHSISAAVAGAAGALLLRRQILLHHPSSGNSRYGHAGYDDDKPSKNALSTYDTHHKSDEPILESLENASIDHMNDVNGNSNSNHHHHHHQRLTRRTDTSYHPPDSPSKVKGAAVGLNALFGGGDGNGATSKELRGMAVPSMAMGAVVAAASLAQSTALGWYFARLLLPSHLATDVTVPSVVAMTVQGLVAGGAARAAMGCSSRLGGLLGAVLGMVSASSMLTVLSDADSVVAEAIKMLKYPLGWTDTLSAAACGAMTMAALMEVAVAMSLNGRHARFGVLVGLILFGGAYTSLFAACHVASLTGACTMLVVAF